MRKRFVLMAVLVVAVGSVEAGEAGKDATAADLMCCWTRDDDTPNDMMRFEPTRVVNLTIEGIEVYPASYAVGHFTLTVSGQTMKVRAKMIDGKLRVIDANGKETLYKKFDDVANKLDISPMPLGDATKIVDPSRIAEIKQDLSKRVIEDQAVRTQPARQADMSKVDKDNTGALRALVQEIGWIDAGRFGRDTSSHAFLIVQHSGDLRLMQAALPLIEKDMKQGIGSPQDYALLYDRLKLRLGEKQRYGSQVGADGEGNPVVLPLENRAKVEQFRQEIGLFPLAQYLAIMEKLQGKKIRFADDEKP